jgi:hypothetical protein
MSRTTEPDTTGPTAGRVPLSRANVVLFAVLAVGLLATLALGLWPQAVMLGVALLIGAVGVAMARRPAASDVTRVDALEYRDERDRRIARDGFAIVGAAALALSVGETVVAGVLAPGWVWPAAVQTVLLAVVWGAANRVAARRH